MNHFEIQYKDPNSNARCGRLRTEHGVIETPVFMPVGTSGAVKGILPDLVAQAGAQIILANTYHLMIRPGVENVEALGGLHKFMAWNRPILTDSGGYQVFSLSKLNRIDDDGVEFASHIDGAKVMLDARRATEIQMQLGADIFMCFDQCTPFPCEQKELRIAVERTIRWAKICKDVHSEAVKNSGNKQLLFGIVQGGIDEELRSFCAKELTQIDFDGFAIGGLSVGEGHDHMIRTAAHTTALLPEGKPRYLMGVGTPADIIASVRAGVDMFDCVMPTRNGRNSYAFTEDGPLRMRNSALIADRRPIEPGCDCYGCSNYTRGAIRHFFNIGEMLGPILTALHNIRFYQRLMKQIGENIQNGQFTDWAEAQLVKYRDYRPRND